MSKVRVAYFAPFASDPTSFYRISGVLNFIQHPDIDFINLCGLSDWNWASFHGATHFIIQRPYTESHLAMIKLARDMGIKVIADYDDNLLEVPKENPCFDLYQKTKDSCVSCLKEVDEAWVATPSIKERYEGANDNVIIIPNGFNDYVFNSKKKFSQNRICTYRGGLSHDSDIGAYLEDIVKTINENKMWEFRFIGSSFEKLNTRTGRNHTFTPPLPIIQFFRYMFETNSSLFFYPLATNIFNSGKSNISLMESTYAGSCFMGNKSLPEFDLPFVVDISEGMNEPFLDIKDDFERMEKMNKDAWDWIVSERLLSNINKKRIERLLV